MSRDLSTLYKDPMWYRFCNLFCAAKKYEHFYECYKKSRVINLAVLLYTLMALAFVFNIEDIPVWNDFSYLKEKENLFLTYIATINLSGPVNLLIIFFLSFSISRKYSCKDYNFERLPFSHRQKIEERIDSRPLRSKLFLNTFSILAGSVLILFPGVFFQGYFTKTKNIGFYSHFFDSEVFVSVIAILIAVVQNMFSQLWLVTILIVGNNIADLNFNLKND